MNKENKPMGSHLAARLAKSTDPEDYVQEIYPGWPNDAERIQLILNTIKGLQAKMTSGDAVLEDAIDLLKGIHVKYAIPAAGIMICPGHPQHGWLLFKHPDGQWVTMADLKKWVPLLKG